MVIEGFRTCNDPQLKDFARNLAEQWLRANFEGFEKTGAMYEKYNVGSNTSYAGAGGEYEVQVGIL